jgi:hypothetical protein
MYKRSVVWCANSRFVLVSKQSETVFDIDSHVSLNQSWMYVGLSVIQNCRTAIQKLRRILVNGLHNAALYLFLRMAC